MNRDTPEKRHIVPALAVVAVLALGGCTTATGSSTYGGPDDPASLLALGVDSHGNQIGAAWPSIPHSNQISLNGDMSGRYLQLGKENFRGDNFGTAERYFRKAVETRPDNPSAWAGLAASYDQLGRFDLADRAYDALSNLRKGDARIANNRGYSYLLRGDYEKARQYLNDAKEMDPGLVEVDGNLELLNEVTQT